VKPYVLFLLLAGALLTVSLTTLSCGTSGESFEPIVCDSDSDCPEGQICSVNFNCVDPF